MISNNNWLLPILRINPVLGGTKEKQKELLLGHPGFKPRIETGPPEYEVQCVDRSSTTV